LKNFTIAAGCLLILAACTGNDLLKNNLACNNFRPQIQEGSQKEDTSFNKKATGRQIKTSDLEVFYSPKTKSCMYVIRQESFWANSGYSALFLLNNYFDNQIIESAEGGDGFTKNLLEAEAEFKKIVEDYK